MLAFNAGCINSTALVGFTHLSASHVTGNMTLFASAFAQRHFEQMAMVCMVLLSFLFGAVIRTTHLTGLTSDMGFALGNWLAGRAINKKLFVFQAMIW